MLHMSTKVVDETIVWLRSEYDSIFEDGSGAMKVLRSKKHTYLAMDLDYSHKGKCRVTMFKYLDGILQAFNEAV